VSEQAIPNGPDPGTAPPAAPGAEGAAGQAFQSAYPAPHNPTAGFGPAGVPADPWRDPSTVTYTAQPATGPQPYATGQVYPTGHQYPPPQWAPGTPWAGHVPPAGKRRSGVAIALSVAAAFVVLCVVGAGVAAVVIDRQSKNTAGTTAGRRSSGATPATSELPSAAAVLDGPTLLTRLLPAPAGARKVPLTGTSNGVMDLDQFVTRIFRGHQRDRQALESEDFRVAAEEYWRYSGGTSTDLQLLQFGTADDAQDFVQGQFDAFSADPGYTNDFDIPGVTNGHGFANMNADDNGDHRAFLVGQRGSIAVVIVFYSKTDFDQPAELALITAQGQALP